MTYKVTLYRKVGQRVRYYKFKILPTLLGEYLLVREYGGMRNTKPTRVIKEYFTHIEDIYSKIDEKLNEKFRRGYSISKRVNSPMLISPLL